MQHILTRFMIFIIHFMFVFSFCMLGFILCVFCVFVLFCVLFLLTYIAVSFLCTSLLTIATGGENPVAVHHHHRHHLSVMELGHLLTCSGLTNPEVCSKIFLDSFYHLGNIVSLPWVIYYEAFYFHVVSSSSCIPVFCPRLVSFLIPLQFVYLFRNLSKCILLFFSYISSLLLLF